MAIGLPRRGSNQAVRRVFQLERYFPCRFLLPTVGVVVDRLDFTDFSPRQ